MRWNWFRLKSNIVRVEDLVRLRFSALELSRCGKINHTKNGANHGHIAMFTPGRVNEKFNHAFADNAVLDLSDEVQKTNQMQASGTCVYSGRFIFNPTARVV
jgi:hypothetical protein